ncbi:transporter [Rhizobium albus]|nr:transporter [Rhizobium albus]
MLPSDPPFVATLGLTIAVGLAAALTASRLRNVLAALCLILAGLASAAAEADRRAITVLDSPVVTTISGRVLSREIDEEGRWRYLVEVRSTHDPTLRRPPERVRLLARSNHPDIEIGASIIGLARLAPPSGPAMPGTFDFAFNSYFAGIGAFGFFYGPPGIMPGDQAEESYADRIAQWTTELRETIAFRIKEVIPGDAGAVAAAMTVSDRRAISEETNEAFRITGLAHILSISGLHMSLAAALMFTGLRLGFALVPGAAQAWPVKKFAALGAIGTSTFYLLISGAVISAQRAWIMVVVMLVAVLLDRAALTMRNVAIAAFLILLVTPSAVTSPGFQMSFAATAALIAAYGGWAARNRNKTPDFTTSKQGFVWRWTLLIVGLAVTSLIAGAATGIFSAHHFHRMSSYGMIANVIAMPVISVIVMPFGTLALLTMPFGLDAIFLTIMGLGLEAVIAIGHHVAAYGDGFATGKIPGAVTALLSLALLILVFTRTWLRSAALLPALAAAFIMTADLRADRPLLLIAEDARLAGILREDGLATNRARPSSFIFDQWATATRLATHVPPIVVVDAQADLPSAETPVEPVEGDTEIDPAIAYGTMRRAVLDLEDGQMAGVFRCRRGAFCVARLENGTIVAWLEEPAYVGPACDMADIAIIPIPLTLRECRSGAKLFTARTLRETGAIAVYAASMEQGFAANEARASGTELGDGTGPKPAFRFEEAAGRMRAWTRHRYYDWRTGSFAEPGQGNANSTISSTSGDERAGTVTDQ